MIGSLLDLSIRRRWLVLLLSGLAALLAAFAATRLPIDAVPDITNNQVQINTTAPSLSPEDVERQVTYRWKRRWPASRASATPARSRATASPR